ncbi:MAG TPA: peptide ABC transporter substrate-binding protein [Candidatus Cybelea sp.]|jgi:peptide/nickel transport system substrate-binding protein|nr:peptide ABC transporter substrate-binding protein [Candidatus Cybelea sp.]
MNARLSYLAAGIAVAIGLCACTKSASVTSGGGRMNSWTQPHVLRFADAGDVNTLNPHLGQFADIGYLSSMTMAYLIKWDEHNNPYPELATQVPTQADGGVSKDGLTITYHLRKGARWSDGAPFDADDVVFSTNVVNNPANNEVGRLGWDQITKVDEPDKYTVVYHLKKPYSPFIETFFSTAGANPCILPKHLLAQYPNINHVAYNSLPIGIGPFKYLRWNRAQDIVLVPNPLYWRGHPRLKEVIYKIIPDRDTVLSQLQAHEIDMWDLVPGAYLARAQGVLGVSILRQPSYFYNHLDFNIQRPAVKDPVVREALRLAIDRRTLIEKIGRGVGILQEVTTPKNAPYAVTSIPPVPFDIARANALLDQAGWTRGPDGIRAKNGVRLALDYAVTAGSQDVDNQIELQRSWWKQIGVGISVRHYPPAMMFAPLQQGGIVYGNKWDIIGFAWLNDAIGDQSAIYSCRSFPPNGQNNLRWCNPRAQAAMDALFTHYDQVRRNGDQLVIQRELVKDVPTIVTALREDIFGYNTDLKNFHPNAITPFDNMLNVDI